MHIVEYVIAAVIGLVVLFYLVYGGGVMLKLFTWDLYHHWKYTQRGLCLKCHKPAKVTSHHADQQYGPSTIKQVVCDCGGAPSIPMGNRHFSEW